MATVRSQFFAGKAVNVPHTEHRDEGEGIVQFDESGEAEVSETLADALVEFYPRLVAVDAPAEEAEAEEE